MTFAMAWLRFASMGTDFFLQLRKMKRAVCCQQWLPGTAVWLDGVAWDDERNAWIVHNLLNLSEMLALLQHSPFVRDIVHLQSLTDIAKTRGYCTVQACIRVVQVVGVKDLYVILKAEDVPPSMKNGAHPAKRDAPEVVLLASESVVRSVYDVSFESLCEIANQKNEGRTVVCGNLLTSIVISNDGNDGFRFIMAAEAPAPADW